MEACRGRTEGKKPPRGTALAVLQQARKPFMFVVTRDLCCGGYDRVFEVEVRG